MPCSTLLNCWALVLITIGTGEEVRLKKLVDQSAPLVAGATEEEVLALLGEPDKKWEAWGGWLFFGPRPPRWIYGTTIDLRYIIVVSEVTLPNPVPVKIRLFGADDKDLEIEWTPERKVQAVNRPEIEIPNELVGFYEPILWWFEVAKDFERAANN